MHSLVRRYIKTAIAFLFVGLGIGGWMITWREVEEQFPSAYIVSAHSHAILVGFVMMMILGVALWLFPRPDKNDPRYSPRQAEVAYWLLAVGTSCRIVGELARAASSARSLRIGVAAAGWLQVAGLVLFFYTMLSRIRGLGSSTREARGERF